MPKERTIVVSPEDLADEDTTTQAKYVGTYIIQKWTWGKKNEIVGKATKVDGVSMMPSVDPGKLNLETLASCLIKAPFDHNPNNPNYDALKNMPNDIGDRLIDACTKLNHEVSKERKKNLSA